MWKILIYWMVYSRRPISKIMPKTLHRSKSKIWSSTYFFFSFILCIYTNKYNILCRFYVILFVHFYIKKYNSVPFYFICYYIYKKRCGYSNYWLLVNLVLINPIRFSAWFLRTAISITLDRMKIESSIQKSKSTQFTPVLGLFFWTQFRLTQDWKYLIFVPFRESGNGCSRLTL